ncbi:MAG TPA: BrnT family toxin [Stellaceae bacterium]|jgi:uncharacterized DUF497 family protein|nr:BrnT family toxin [Stellaceae bacterium]
MHPEEVVRVAGFDWDAANRAKCERHGVATAIIETLFRQPIAVVPDPAHSNAETRFRAIGRTAAGRYVLMVFTLRHRADALLIRPISARYMHRKEVRHYEEEIAKAEKR